jgi:hypothetical protein
VLYSTDAEADRQFLRDVLRFPFVDAGHDWLIFAVPPTEIAVHPAEANGGQELFLMCDDIEAFKATMADLGVRCSDVTNQRWGLLLHLTLPGGGQLGVYQPSHPTPGRHL